MKRGLLLLFTFCALAIYAQGENVEMPGKAFEAGGLKYRLFEDSHEAIIDNYNSWEGTLDIPSEIVCNGQKYTVSGIAWLAFVHCHTLTKVMIPNTIREVFTYSVNPDSNKNPFIGCTSLESIEVAEDNPAFCSVDGVLFDKEKKLLCSYPPGARQKQYIVPEGTETIAANTFSECGFLDAIHFPETVHTIYASVFSDCVVKEIVIRAHIGSNLTKDVFRGLNESATLYVPAIEVETYKSFFSGTVLPLEAYQTGLSTLELSTNEPVLFDLQGRRLMQAPQKGFYIQEGKKRLAK